LRLLVTGGLGFIGSNFIRYALSKHADYELICFDKIGIGANPDSLKDLETEERYKFIKGDIADFGVVSEVLREVDAVVNFAAETHVDRSIADPESFFESNTLGTFTLLEAVRNSNPGAKVVHVSTDEVYGDIPIGSSREGDPLKPSSPYSASKAAAEMFCLAHHRTYGLNVTVTRCTNNFGPYQHPEKLIPKTIIRARLNLPVPVYGKGTNVRDWIYVLDHCEALDLTLKRGKAGEIYNISSGNELPNIRVVEAILKTMRKSGDLVAFVEDRPGHDLRYSLDSSKIRSLGWTPQHSFIEALGETVKWYLENEWWWKPLIDEKILHPTPWKLR